jgi:[acyl-carrier-protein] S-malonyltransferase
MAPAQAALAPLLRAASLRSPTVAMVSSVSGAAVTDLEAYRSALLGQMTAPVRWERAVRTLAGGAAHFVEVGPGRVLTGLDREMVRGASHRTAMQARRLAAAAASDRKAI